MRSPTLGTRMRTASDVITTYDGMASTPSLLASWRFSERPQFHGHTRTPGNSLASYEGRALSNRAHSRQSGSVHKSASAVSPARGRNARRSVGGQVTIALTSAAVGISCLHGTNLKKRSTGADAPEGFHVLLVPQRSRVTHTAPLCARSNCIREVQARCFDDVSSVGAGNQPQRTPSSVQIGELPSCYMPDPWQCAMWRGRPFNVASVGCDDGEEVVDLGAHQL